MQNHLNSQGYSNIVIKEPTKDSEYAKEIMMRSKNRVFNETTTPEHELKLFVEDRRENVEK